MRKDTLRMLACQMLAVIAFSASAQEATTEFKALEQGPAIAKKALRAAMLAIERAGDRLVAVGERGIILLSDDGGVEWRQAVTPVGVSLTGVQFVTARLGWAIGHLGVVLRTSDGGETWVKLLDGIQAADVVLKSAQGEVPPSDERIEQARRLVQEGPDKPFLAMHFDNERRGYVLGAFGLALRTDDGGETWAAWDARIDNPDGLHAYAMKRVRDGLFIVGEQGLMLRSLDDGASFTRLESPYGGSYFGLLAGSGGELLAYGLRGNVYRSADQGTTWSRVETGLEVSIGAATEFPDGTIVMRSQAGDVLVSHDRGRSFGDVPGANKVPASGLAPAPDGALVVASLRGVFRAELTKRASTQ